MVGPSKRSWKRSDLGDSTSDLGSRRQRDVLVDDPVPVLPRRHGLCPSPVHGAPDQTRPRVSFPRLISLFFHFSSDRSSEGPLTLHKDVSDAKKIDWTSTFM